MKIKLTKKKIIIISVSVLAAAALITAAAASIFYNKYIVRKAAAPYKEYPVTRDLSVNEKMEDMKNSIGSKPTFSPKISRTMSASKIKLTANSKTHAKENAKALNKAVKNAKNGTKILLPEGTFYLDASISVSRKKNITISAEGVGALLINTAYSPYQNKDKSPNVFNIFSSENIKIENISFDYLNHVSAEGVIIEQTETETRFKLYTEYLNGTREKLCGGEAVSSVFTANHQGFLEENWPENPVNLQKHSKDIFSVPIKIGDVGQKIACRFNSKGAYVSYVINATNTNGLILKNLRCYSCPGGFVLATSGNSNLYFEKLKVAVMEGSERLLGSNEDCLHLRDISGTLTVIDSTFSGIGDDALNIHSGIGKVEKIKDNVVSAATQDYFAKTGETIEFFDKDFNSLGLANIKKIRRGKITLDTLPQKAKNAVYIQNVSLLPDTVVSNCSVSFARARGFLIQAKNSVVEGCNFENIRLPAILAAPDFEYWLEGGFCENILIENNSFNNCASLNNGMGVVHFTIGQGEAVGKENCTLGHKNVSILNNNFKNCVGQSIIAYNVINLKLE